MKETRIIMGMPVTLMTPHETDSDVAFKKVFDFFNQVDKRYSPYIDSSEVSQINRHELTESDYSIEMHEILELAENTKHETDGYFDVWHDHTFDPSGIVKGWAIQRAASILQSFSDDFYIEAGGDIQVSGNNDKQQSWRVGIRNPFNRHENISIISLGNHAVATSGSAIRGQHIYDPISGNPPTDIVSLSVIAPRIIDADRMATAAFAMGSRGIEFIEKLKGYEGYMVSANKNVTMTNGWKKFEVNES
ncbi:MAG: FAD:protein FMN transferase [Candidatus Nomurabacteria bacterium]|nr:MAG: FAD:protein FMN transferase [Candidatus Nomurabacteria bacterium]